MRIAFVKQDLYQDLYVCGTTASASEALESTLMRIGPLSLIADFNSDFYIIKEQKEKECKSYMRSWDVGSELKYQLQHFPANKITAGNFSYLKPLSNNSHADFSINPDDIDWSKYDCVISINVSIPTRIVRKYRSVLWCYMFGEANADHTYPHFGYDAILTQNLSGEVAAKPGIIDFPYTFIGPNTLEKIAIEKFGQIDISHKTGVYAEINNTTLRPVTSVPCLDFVKKLGHEVIIHDQDIMENLKRVYKAKYFVKLEGRKIRGNSIIEAISAGTLVLMNPKDVTHSQLLPKETWIHSSKELSDLINYLDNNPDKYMEFLSKQRALLDFFVISTPMESLQNALNAKREGISPDYPTLKKKIKQVLTILGVRK